MNWPKVFQDIAYLALVVLLFYLAKRVHTRSKVMKDSLWIVEEGQFEVAPQRLLDQAIEHAKAQGLEMEYLHELAEVRRRYGYEALKIGHLYWATGRISGEIEDPVPPSFERAKTTEVSNSK